MKGQFLAGVPVFLSTDFDRTVHFYHHFGMQEVARYEQGYLILRRDGFELHFGLREEYDAAQSVLSAYVRVLNIKALTIEWADLQLPTEGLPRYVAAKLKPWGMVEAHIVDPDGNLLIIGVASEDLQP